MEPANIKSIIKLVGFGIILALCNYNLFLDTTPSSLIFQQNEALQGEWWRVITHPFVHVSWYHLSIDALAVVLLWREIEMISTLQKLFISMICSASSLATAVCFSPVIQTTGYCGLSGVAHGLMAFLALTWILPGPYTDKHDQKDRVRLGAGMVLLIFSLGKSIVEVISDFIIFSHFHMGELGVPIVHAHLGGALGGIATFIVVFVRYRSVQSRELARFTP